MQIIKIRVPTTEAYAENAIKKIPEKIRFTISVIVKTTAIKVKIRLIFTEFN